MKIEVSGFANGSPIPGKFAFCVKDPKNHVAMSDNINPRVHWSEIPAGTKSFLLILVDKDVPSQGDKVNKEGMTVPADLPRVDFYHWVLADIPLNITEIAEGAVSNGITARGKNTGKTPYGVCGFNDYTGWFTGDKDMEGVYGGYDGPCPPWNDERLHHYTFRVYALDVTSLGLSGAFNGQTAEKATKGHVLEIAEWHGTYTLNPQVG
ncbi:MAG: YbhB/YbcL family Raf kinase inhibitor-like protein [SAR324 cluster bacterium]|nr:YbhB/YbcL family Raf kinase inhibitor-like protein [SAR324 cluster bacterium]